MSTRTGSGRSTGEQVLIGDLRKHVAASMGSAPDAAGLARAANAVRLTTAVPATAAACVALLVAAILNGAVLGSWDRALCLLAASVICGVWCASMRREAPSSGTPVTAAARMARCSAALAAAALTTTAGLLAPAYEATAGGGGGFDASLAGGTATVAFSVDAGAAPFVALCLLVALGVAGAVVDTVVVAVLWSAYHFACVFGLRAIEGDAAVVAVCAYFLAGATCAAQVASTRGVVALLVRASKSTGMDIRDMLSPAAVRKASVVPAGAMGAHHGVVGASGGSHAHAPGMGLLSPAQASTLRDLSGAEEGKASAPVAEEAHIPLRDQGVALLKRIKELVPAQAGLISYCVSLILASHATEAKQLRLLQSNAELMDEDTNRWLSSTLQIRGSGMKRHRSSDNIASRFSGSQGKRSTSMFTDTAIGGIRRAHAVEWPPPVEARAIMDGILSFDFDVFELAQALPTQRLPYVAYELFNRMDLFAIFDIDSQRFFACMDRIENTYSYDPRSPNPYHDALHAADVAQAVTVFLQEPRVQTPLDDLDTLGLIFSAIVHDYRHPGVSNNFLIASKAVIAVRYNDDSVLENFHSASAFMLLAKPQFAIFNELEEDAWRRLRKIIIHCVLSTDLAKGGHILEAFKKDVVLPVESGELSVGSGMDTDCRMAVMAMAIKCADVGHPARPFHVHLQWSKMITAEFYAQGDLERQRGMEISPLCDRRNHNLSKSQLGFIDFVVRPAFALFSRYVGTKVYLEQLQHNYEEWKSGRVVSEAKDFAAPATRKGFAMRSLSTLAYEDEPDALPGHGRGASLGGSLPGVSRAGSMPSMATLPTTSEEDRDSRGGDLPPLVRPSSHHSLGVPVTVTSPAPSPVKVARRRSQEGTGAGTPGVGGAAGSLGHNSGTADSSSGPLTKKSSVASTGGESFALVGGTDLELGGSRDSNKILMHVPTPAKGGAGGPHHYHRRDRRHSVTGEGLEELDKGANEATMEEVRSRAVPMPNLRAHGADILMENVEAAARTPVVEHLPDPDNMSEYGFGNSSRSRAYSEAEEVAALSMSATLSAAPRVASVASGGDSGSSPAPGGD
uniref:Phosphodiesterase n=1 Tax=Bicosoecida sp. CB-2014 TaxID=1486930 RepID=A0A7S1CCP6_9STRA|mmetsp:Transcript_19294/g.68171  ORF Transcript_19294/g.68171 Transcript_19294/m.68171 type:complete len:1076 (+) Transcript_19294:203-3430(+)